ncbi:RGS domain-containing protein [Meloidogyne graminicola]|uniref:RGS domain-containing protein n=1 Tax=Meloidogyne graminicola TaxID=189291 RepID=A0A8S9ZFW2_9BILA|nr:RGS domain-containing protein [Meloidogyne graminicola]
MIKNQKIYVCRLSGKLTACDLRNSRRCYAERLKGLKNKNNEIKNNFERKGSKKRIFREEKNEEIFIQKLENSPSEKINNRQLFFNSSPQLEENKTINNSSIFYHSKMPTCHRKCHNSPTTQRLILKSKRHKHSLLLNKSTTTLKSSDCLFGITDNYLQENKENIEQLKDNKEKLINTNKEDLKLFLSSSSFSFVSNNSVIIKTNRLHSSSSTDFTTNFLNQESVKENYQPKEVSLSPIHLEEISSPRSVKIRLLERNQQQIGLQKSPIAVVPMPTGVGNGGSGTNSPQHQQTVGLDIDLEQFLRSETARAPFHQFLQQQFCAENINFYLAVEEYKKIPEEEIDRRLDFGRQIYDRHFAANCIEPVNIDNSTSNQIREAHKNNRFTSNVFDVVQYQIFHLLKYDCWPRYLRAGGQLTEEFIGDSKSHDSGASQHQNSKIHNNNSSSTTNRRKSLFLRLLRFQRVNVEQEEDEILLNEDNKNNEKICHCSIPFIKKFNGELLNGQQQQQQRKPLIPLNSQNNILINKNLIERNTSTKLPKKTLNNTKRTRKSYGGTSNIWKDVIIKQRQNCCRACNGIIFGESKPDFPLRYCTLLCADSATSTEITLSDPFQSVKQWTITMAENCGLDKSTCEVVDAQTGSTIDPVRQAVDALNNRVVRIMPVVKFPVVFLGPSACPTGGGTGSTSSKPTAPLPAKVVILRCRPALTIGKVLRPIMSKYNVDTEQAIVCLAGTCDVLKLQTPVSNIYQKTLSVMTQQQFAERKLLPKRELQKELTIVPNWMISSNNQSSPISPEIPQPPFHQHGDISFCEVTLESESIGSKLGGGLLLKHSATRSYSSNPREFFKFGRKPTVQSKGIKVGIETEPINTTTTITTNPQSLDSSNQQQQQQPSTSSSTASHLRYRKSGGSSMGVGRNSSSKEADRRKSLGAAASAISPIDGNTEQDEGGSIGHSKGPRLSGTALSVGLVEPSDIPYCGEITNEEITTNQQQFSSSYSVQSSITKVLNIIYFLNII